MDRFETKALNFARSFSILMVFIGHNINAYCPKTISTIIIKLISPGITMSTLGFISGYLLCRKYSIFDGLFYVKRFSRIYSSLFVCMLSIGIFHFSVDYEILNQHTLLHLAGLSFFFDLLNVSNISTIGDGLWFVTVIVILYLFLPLIKVLYCGKKSRLHLMVILVGFLLLNCILYGTMSAFNVIISFNIGCYIGLNSSLGKFCDKPWWFYFGIVVLLMMIDLISMLKFSNGQIRNLIIIFYPYCTIPLLYKLGCSLGHYVENFCTFFASISYEFYLLHFYFLNDFYDEFFPQITLILLRTSISLFGVLLMSYCFAKVSNFLSSTLNMYFSTQAKQAPHIL